MKPNRSKKLISKRSFTRKLSLLKQEYSWFLQNKPFEIRPGWSDIFASTLSKIQSILTNENIPVSHLKYLYCSSLSRLQIFLDTTALTPVQGQVIDHLIAEAQDLSERTCPKCGVKCLARAYKGCDEHCDFEGDFLEDLRSHLASNTLEGKEEDDQTEELNLSPNLASPPKTSHDTACTDFHQFHLYDVNDVNKIKHTLKSRSSDTEARNRIKSICDELISLGGDRPYCKLPNVDAFEDLAESFPNFLETINTMRSSVALANLGNGILEIPPILLVGPPGIGKTQLATEIAHLFDTDFIEIRMETEQSGASISGSSEFWSNTQTGLIFNTLTRGKTANPIVVLDELDKVSADTRFNPTGGLYGLLERETARRFEDQSMRGLPINASGIIWLITANDETLIPEPILSRVMVQRIRPPTEIEAVMIAHSIYGNILGSRPWGKYFSPELLASVAEKLSKLEPRQIKVCLLNAFGKAAVASRVFISPDDIPDIQNDGGHMGFL